MYQQAFNVIVLAELDSLISGLLQIDGVRNTAICLNHLFKRMVIKSKRIGVYRRNHVDTAILKSMRCCSQIRPASYPFKHNSVFFLSSECAGTIKMIFLVFPEESFHGLSGLFLASSCNHYSHVVKQVESVKRRRHILCLCRSFEPCSAGSAAKSCNLFELCIIPFQAK